MYTYPKWKPVPMEVDSQSPTRDNTPVIKAMLKETKKLKAWKCDDITPVSREDNEIKMLNTNFSKSKRDM